MWAPQSLHREKGLSLQIEAHEAFREGGQGPLGTSWPGDISTSERRNQALQPPWSPREAETPSLLWTLAANTHRIAHSTEVLPLPGSWGKETTSE